MFRSPPRRKPNIAQSRKATEDNTSVPFDQALSLEHTNETVTNSNMSETDIETQTSTNAEINMIINPGISSSTGRARVSRTPTPNQPGTIVSGTEQDYNALERKIELLTTRFGNMISQQNSLLERLLLPGRDKIRQVHISNRGDSPLRFPRGRRSEGGEFSSNIHGDKNYRD